ncbi:MAG: glutamate racemase [Anaerolineales bacterium]|nr:glutamate racemase [Anaerolineales bacterium]MCB9129113.1 glutamate racemase [Ardenticatenales bacterium]
MSDQLEAYCHAPIGIFDSGVGGTTVLRAIRQILPHEPLLYLADQARCPYGPRPTHELRRFSMENTQWLLQRGAKMIVVACNTASAAALRWLRNQLPDVTFVGMVPALKPAALSSQSGVVGVLATPATMQGALLQEVREQWAQGVTLVERVGDGLVPLIEAGRWDDEVTRALLWRYLEPMVEAGADRVVLGCTHYPYLIPLIEALAPTLQIIDAAPAVAQQVARLINDQGIANRDAGATVCYATSGAPATFAALLTALQAPPGDVIGVEEPCPTDRKNEISSRWSFIHHNVRER